MRTKMIIRSIGALLSLFALVMFVLVGCSKDDNTNDSPNAFEPGYEWPSGDYPSLIAPDVNEAPIIGNSILAEKAKHIGDFSPLLEAYYGKDWHGSVSYDAGIICGSDTDHWSVSGEKWSNQLPSQGMDFDLYWTCGDESFTFNASDFGWNSQRRIGLMDNGQWSETEYDFSEHTSSKTFRTYFKQVLGHPDLYVSMERDWIFESGTDVMEHEGTHTVKTWTKTGVEDFEETTFSQTLELGASASYGAVATDLNVTFSNTTTHSVNISTWKYSEKSTTYTIPSNETWRFFTLHGIERYFFSDSNGNRWQSPNNLVLVRLEELENNIRTFVMIVKYKSDSVSAYGSELIEIESLKE